MPRLLISDANILIDMECGGLLDRMFAVDYEFAVLDVLFEEELAAEHPDLPAKGLRVLGLTDVGVTHATVLIANQSKSGIGRIDLLALALAIQESCPLLTGDRRLRELCEDIGHEVRGTLWLVRAMHESGLLTHAQAVAAYDAMKAQGRCLPWDEIATQLRHMRRR